MDWKWLYDHPGGAVSLRRISVCKPVFLLVRHNDREMWARHYDETLHCRPGRSMTEMGARMIAGQRSRSGICARNFLLNLAFVWFNSVSDRRPRCRRRLSRSLSKQLIPGNPTQEQYEFVGFHFIWQRLLLAVVAEYTTGRLLSDSARCREICIVIACRQRRGPKL